MELALLSGPRAADMPNIQRTDIRDGALWIMQDKNGTKRAIEVTGELAAVIARMNGRQRDQLSPYLLQDDHGHPISKTTLRSRFNKARTVAKVRWPPNTTSGGISRRNVA